MILNNLLIWALFLVTVHGTQQGKANKLRKLWKQQQKKRTTHRSLRAHEKKLRDIVAPQHFPSAQAPTLTKQQINELLAENERLVLQLDAARMGTDIPYPPQYQRQQKQQTMTKQQVHDLFLATTDRVRCRIEDVERDIKLLNVPDQALKYEVNLALKCNQLGRTRDQVEKYLWHGSRHDTIQTIIKNGFDRSFNKVMGFGMGNYFARDAEYSATLYAPEHTDGYHYILLCRVIVGELTLPHDDREPLPPGARWPKILLRHDDTEFDTFVDNVEDPTIFGSYRDFMAIPAYLVKFKRKD